MKDLRFRLILIVVLIGLSVYLLHFTYADYKNTQKLEKIKENVIGNLKNSNSQLPAERIQMIAEAKVDSVMASDPSYISDREKRIKLGLDLQGGMYVVMEVNTVKLLEKLAKDPDNEFRQVMKEVENESRISQQDVVSLMASKLEARGIRLSRYFGNNIRETDGDIVSRLNKQSEDAVSRAMEIIRTRVDKYGVSEPSIQKQGARRIIVELPGVAKEEEARQLLQGSALLEFKLLVEPQRALEIMQRIDQVVAGNLKTDSTGNDSLNVANAAAQANQDTTKELTKEEAAKQHPFFAIAPIDPRTGAAEAFVKESDKTRLSLMLNRPEVQRVIPNNVEFLFSAKSERGQDGNYYMLYCVNKNPELTGGYITDASANLSPTTSQPEVTMQMNAEGAREWARITGANIKKRIAIVLDGEIYSAPTVQNKIPNGSSQITGMKDLAEAKLMEIVLKAGALPAPVEIMEQRTVGPSLGQDSIMAGMNSAIIGFLLVSLFMIIYYQKAGGVADIALFINILFILGVLAGFGATLTLPGIAGIVLTMGMAVDANVLIYERMREEIATGKTMRAVVNAGFKNALPAIVDSNLVTFFTGIILYQFGSGPVQGFALTLMIGIVSSLVGALVITRVIFDYMVYKNYSISLG